MNPSSPSVLDACFRFIIARRWWIVAFYAAVLGPSIYYSLRVQQDNSLERLIVQSDPDYAVARAFEKVFGSGEYVVLLAEATDPFDPAVLRKLDGIEKQLSAIPHVEANSILSVYRRARAGFEATPAESATLRRFATATNLFKKQGLIGDHYLSVALLIHSTDAAGRYRILSDIDQVVNGPMKSPAPFLALRKVGQPYVNSYLDQDTRQAGMRYFPLFFLFVVFLNIALYRSFRALLAFMITLGTSAALTVGYIGVTGGVFTIVSSLVPMTILITCTATLVYIHSRFVEHPPGRTRDEHQVFALSNKFLACTASVFATAVGFAALAVSKIRPIREMGIWVAVGLLFTWIIVFTLFPALQKILNTPTEQERKIAGQWFERFTLWLPYFSYRWRWVLVPSSLLLCLAGLVALFGIPHLISPMHLETNALEYLPHHSDLYRDTKRLESDIGGLSITEVWLQGKSGNVTDAKVVLGVKHFAQALEKEPSVGSVVGMPTMLAMLRYLGGAGAELPDTVAELEPVSATLETLLEREPMLQRFVDKETLSQTHLAVITRTMDYDGLQALDQMIRQRWDEAVKRDPALGEFHLQLTGLAPLQAKISHHLVPTLVESFVISIIIIYGAFLLVFRNGAARLMAMIPSLFAILLMFAFMRVIGVRLNVATIIVASTVLGTSENDQIHFFYHFLEKRKNGTTEESLIHTLRIAGRAIFFATLINAGGFLAFALADLPPIRQFGLLSCVAFVLSMIADFTALPAALWMVFRERPGKSRPGAAVATPEPAVQVAE